MVVVLVVVVVVCFVVVAPPSADLRYREEDSISHSTLVLAAIKS